MKRALSFAILVFTYIQSFAQSKGSDLSVTLGYPIPVGYNFINKAVGGYTGIADIGLDYTIFKASKIDVGILMNASFLKFKPGDVSLTILSPKVKIGYTIQLKKVDIQPQLAIGYAHFSFNGSENNYKENSGGLAARASTKVIFKTERKINYYLSLAYELDKIADLTPGGPSTSFNRHAQFITPGVGILWKFSQI